MQGLLQKCSDKSNLKKRIRKLSGSGKEVQDVQIVSLVLSEVLSKLKCRGFRATSLSTYDFSTLYTTLPHNLIKEKLLDMIEWTFKRALKTMVHFSWHVMAERLFSLPLTKVGVHFGHVRMCATPCPIYLIIFILDLGPSYTDKLLEFRWVKIAHLS